MCCSRGCLRTCAPTGPVPFCGLDPRAGPEAAAPAGGAEDLRAVDRLRQDDGADRVVEIEMRGADERRQSLPTARRRSADRSRRSRGRPRRTGCDVTSPRRMLISGCDAIASVTRDENRSRSTASAAPAGTRASSAHRMMSDPSRRISSFSRPTALSSLSPRKEFEQTSSARPSVLWTAVGFTGRISWRTTGTPRDADLPGGFGSGVSRHRRS